MKKFLALLMSSGLFLFTACGSTAGKTENVKIDIGQSSRFTKSEIEQAIDATIGQFKEFEHCELHSLSYDEEKSELQLENYREDFDLDNMVVLFSDFYVDSKAGGGWEPNSDYNWMFFLSRENKDGDWSVDDWGY